MWSTPYHHHDTRVVSRLFFDQGSDVPNPRELDPSRKNLMVNLMVFDDLMLRKQNTCEDNVDCFYLCQNYFTLPRQSIRENANFPCLFQQNAKNIDHIRHDRSLQRSHQGTVQFDALCKHCWSKPYGFVTIDFTSTKANGKYAN